MKKLLYTILILGSFYSYAQNNVYGKYIKAIDSLDAAFIRVDDLTFDGSIISATNGMIISSGTGVVRLSRTTDQLRFGTTNTTTINSVAPSASRSYIIPDAGESTSFIMGAGANNIIGSLTVDDITLNGNDITTATNTDLTLAPNGTGILDVQSDVSLSDNALQDVGSGTVASGSFYETGTFTPTVKGSTIAGSATYTTQTGRYTRIGNLVTVYVYVNYSGGTGTGNLFIDGLPFTAINPAAVYAPPPSIRLINIALTASYAYTGLVNPNSTQIFPRQYPTGGGADINVPYDGAGEILINATYETTY
jgi:hypothetical protein